MTLTLGMAYLTVLAHERNRRAQAQALRSQSRVLNSLFEPEALPPPQSRAELAREERSTLVETAKDRWNEEIENAVRLIQKTDWNDVREGIEGAVSRLLGSSLQKSREGINDADRLGGREVQKAVNSSEAAVTVKKAAASTVARIEKVEADTIEGASRIIELTKSGANEFAKQRDSAKAKVKKTVSITGSGEHDAAEPTRIGDGSGTVNAARGVVREVINKGMDKGRQAIDKAQIAVGLAEERIESTVRSSAFSHS